MLLQEKEGAYTALTAEVESIQAEKGEMVEKLEAMGKELFELRTKCRDIEYTMNSKEETILELQKRLATQAESSAIEVSPPPTIKVSSIGASKKPRSRGKGGRASNEPKPASPEVESSVSSSEISSLNSKILVLEQANASLSEQVARLAVLESELTSLQEQFDSCEQDKRTLQKRVDLLLSELDSNENKGNLAFDLHFKMLDLIVTHSIFQMKQITCRSFYKPKEMNAPNLRQN